MIDTLITVTLWLLFIIAVLQGVYLFVRLYRRWYIRRLNAKIDKAYEDADYPRCPICSKYHLSPRCPR